jgi:hypothetical protein
MVSLGLANANAKNRDLKTLDRSKIWIKSQSNDKQTQVWGHGNKSTGSMFSSRKSNPDAIISTTWSNSFQIQRFGRVGNQFRFIQIVQFNFEKKIYDVIAFKYSVPKKSYQYFNYWSVPMRTKTQSCPGKSDSPLTRNVSFFKDVINKFTHEDLKDWIRENKLIHDSCGEDSENITDALADTLVNPVSKESYIGCLKSIDPITATALELKASEASNGKKSIISCSPDASPPKASLTHRPPPNAPDYNIVLKGVPRIGTDDQKSVSYREDVDHEITHLGYSQQGVGSHYGMPTDEEPVKKLASCCRKSKSKDCDIKISAMQQVESSLPFFSSLPALHGLLASNLKEATNSVAMDVESLKNDLETEVSKQLAENDVCTNEPNSESCLNLMSALVTRFQRNALNIICRTDETDSDAKSYVPVGFQASCNSILKKGSPAITLDAAKTKNLIQYGGDHTARVVKSKGPELAEVEKKVTAVAATLPSVDLVPAKRLAFNDEPPKVQGIAIAPVTNTGDDVPPEVSQALSDSASNAQLSLALFVAPLFMEVAHAAESESPSPLSVATSENTERPRVISRSESTPGSSPQSNAKASKTSAAARTTASNTRSPAGANFDQENKPLPSPRSFSASGAPTRTKFSDVRADDASTSELSEAASSEEPVVAVKLPDEATSKPASKPNVADTSQSSDARPMKSSALAKASSAGGSGSSFESSVSSDPTSRSTGSRTPASAESRALPKQIITALQKVFRNLKFKSPDRKSVEEALARNGIQVQVGRQVLGERRNPDKVYSYQGGKLTPLSQSDNGKAE